MEENLPYIPNAIIFNYGKGLIDSLLKSGDITYSERSNIIKKLAKKYNVEFEINEISDKPQSNGE